jgi:hypothetical protein
MTTWKGINVMKGKPLTVANPKTDPQLMRRSALRQIVAIARSIVAAINFGFKEQAVHKSAFNAFCGYNLRNAFNYAAPPDATLNPSEILIAQGTIAPASFKGAQEVFAGANTTVSWDAAQLLPGQSNSDAPIIALFNETKNAWDIPPIVSPKTRADQQASWVTPAGIVTNDQVFIYLFFYNSTQRKSSDSIQIAVIAQ